MRQELRDYLDSEDSLDDYDLSRTLWIARNFDKGRTALLLKHQKETEQESKNEEDFWTVIDDLNWYAFQESFFIWHFCLWRLQGILEGIMLKRFLPDRRGKNLVGLKAKLDAMRAAEYTVEEVDYQELLCWARVRNQLSHIPPSSHNPGPLKESDVADYHDLCVKVVGIWDKKNGRHPGKKDE